MIHIWFIIQFLPLLLTNTSSFCDIVQHWASSDLHLGAPGEHWGCLLQHTRWHWLEQQPRWALCTAAPQQAAVWKTEKLEGLENVKIFPLKGICERWDQLKFHLILIFLYHCSTKKCVSSVYAVLVLSGSDFIDQVLGTTKCCI